MIITIVVLFILMIAGWIFFLLCLGGFIAKTEARINHIEEMIRAIYGRGRNGN